MFNWFECSFPSLRAVTILRLNNPFSLTTDNWKENSWIHTFPWGISTIWNASNPDQDRTRIVVSISDLHSFVLYQLWQFPMMRIYCIHISQMCKSLLNDLGLLNLIFIFTKRRRIYKHNTLLNKSRVCLIKQQFFWQNSILFINIVSFSGITLIPTIL